MTDEQAFDEDDLRSLGHKLAQLDLTDRERAAMAALLSDDEVAGFARLNIIGAIRVGVIEYQDGDDLFVRPKGGHHGLRADGVVGPKTFTPGRF